MCGKNIILALAFLLQTQHSSGIWSCGSSEECSSLAGAVCSGGECACVEGQQQTLAGTLCADVAPYFTSPCVEDFQCSRFFTGYACRTEDGSNGTCGCQPNHHYYRGRCWSSRDYGDTCNRDEECQNVLLDPNAMSCSDGTCQCTPLYYLKQSGQCRRAGLAPGDGCVLDIDCMFVNGVCDTANFVCVDSSTIDQNVVSKETRQAKIFTKDLENKMADSNISALSAGVVCRNDPSACVAPYQCSVSLGICVCPLGYYPSEDGTQCYAELGSPATDETCVGLLAIIQNGVCTCPVNFYYNVNMRDCVKATLRFTDSCISDQMCHTFGAAAICGPPQDPWGIRSCECIPELAVWDEGRNMCRLFVGLGEICEVDSDCLAGQLDIVCLPDEIEEGIRRCSCPDGLNSFEGLCIDTGLVVGEACQVTQECTGSNNTACTDGVCTCSDGYQVINDICAPVIGGVCSQDTDCVIEDTVCVTSLDTSTCQCREDYVQHEDACWINSSGYNGTCELTAQCTSVLGSGGACVDGYCLCEETHHYGSERCWRRTGLFQTCSSSNECFLEGITDRVVCRNGLCQCDFSYPFSEEIGSCLSGSATIIGNIVLVIGAISYLLSL